MNISYGRAAKDRMRDRSVTESDVESAIMNRLSRTELEEWVTYEGPGTAGDRTLCVIVFPDEDDSESAKFVKSVKWKDEEDD